MNDKDILSEDERRALKSMALYWKEVRSRDDQTPLYGEVVQVTDILGMRILDIVEEYIEATEPTNEGE